MNWKVFGRKRSWPNFKVLSRHSSEGYEKNREKDRIVGLKAEIWTRDLPNTEAGVLTFLPRHAFLTSKLDGGEWLPSSPGRSTSSKESQYPLHRRMGGPKSRSGYMAKRKIISSPESNPSRTVRSLVTTGLATQILEAEKSVIKCSTMNHRKGQALHCICKKSIKYSDEVKCRKNSWPNLI
jgi:hypothetical protein